MIIKDKFILVTGAAKRVGRHIALLLAKKGAHILLHYNASKKEALETALEIQSLNVQCHVLQADLNFLKEINSLFRTVTSLRISVSALINSASIFYKTPMETVEESDWKMLMNINLKAPFWLSRKLGLWMAAGSGGKIINIADWSGFRPYKDYAPYCASKGGLLTLTKALARDLAPKVAVNAIAPGPVLLPDNFSEEDKNKIIQKTPLGRIGFPEDVANAVVFLLENDYINGTVLTVDGGRSIV